MISFNRPEFLFPILVTMLIGIPAIGEETKLKSVTAGSLKLRVPENWKEVKTTSQFRAAQLDVPGQEGEKNAEMVVYYFGGGATGGVKANIERWVGQFEDQDRKVAMTRGNSKLGTYFVADISGIWKKPDGPPFARKTISTPGSRVVNVILNTKTDGADEYYFLKLAGPDRVVKRQAATLRASFGAKAESEKPFKLADSPN